MKILFIQPSMGAWVTWGNHKAINIAHAQFAACLREWAPEIEIAILDCRAMDYSEEQMLEKIGPIAPDVIYFGDAYQMTETVAIYPRYQRNARMIKAKFPNLPILAGGFYIAANYEEAMRDTPEFDYVIAGEQELTIVDFCKEFAKDNPDLSIVKGLVHRIDGRIIINEYRPLIEDLDTLPMPAYDLFPMDKYIGYTYIKPYQEIYTSRGCPFGCTFCLNWVSYDLRGNSDWKNHRFRSAKLVVDELELLNTKYGVKFVFIFDLNFNPSRERVEEFLKEMQERKLDLKYGIMGNASALYRDRDLLPALRKTGFVTAVYGLEVSEDEDLKTYGKGTTVDIIKKVTEQFHELGILSIVTWMMGFPNDDTRKIKERHAALDSIDPDVSSLQMLLPVPGIPMYDEVIPYLDDPDLSKWDFHQPVVRTKHLSKEQLGRLAAWENREFFSSKGRIQRILESKTLDPLAVSIFKSYFESMHAFSQKASGAN